MRKIVHIDADCFYASVEMRDNPRLKGRPIAVGGDPGRRGVIATCNYEARRHGVRSAMASGYAKRLCPELEILKPNISKYKAVSAELMTLLGEYSDYLEPLSLDEAYLDVSENGFHRGSATLLAKEVRARVKAELGISVSAGVAPAKFLAKVASDWRKPDGLFVILPEQVESFTALLPAAKLPGVGPVTAAKLQRFGIGKCADIRRAGEPFMRRHFGLLGGELFIRASGEDERRVQSHRERKSMSVERTFPVDMPNAALSDVAHALIAELQTRLNRMQESKCVRKVFVKLKFDDFRQTTMEAALPNTLCQVFPGLNNCPADAMSRCLPTYQRLIQAAWHREKRPVRLLGLGVRLDPLAGERGAGAAVQLMLSSDW